MINFQKLVTGDNEKDRIQANITKALSQAATADSVADALAQALSQASGPFIGGVLLSGQAVTSAGPAVITHDLGRQPTVWVICDQDTLTDVKRTAWDTTTITLQSGSDCTISLWVN